MEIGLSYENNKILVNDLDPNKGNSNNLTINIFGKKLEHVKTFKYVGVTLMDNIISKTK